MEKSIASWKPRKSRWRTSSSILELTKRPDKMKNLSEKYSKLKDELEVQFDKWQELEERKSALA